VPGRTQATADAVELRLEHSSIAELEQADPLIGRAGDQRADRTLQPAHGDAVERFALTRSAAEQAAEGIAETAV
jgi:hypothetical protein